MHQRKLEMTSVLVFSLFFVLPLFVTPSTYAGWYAGLNAGQIEGSEEYIESATNVGLLGGYEFPGMRFGSIAIEGEVTKTVSKGEIGPTEWELDSLALWYVYRSPHMVYLKGKIGLEYIYFQQEGYFGRHSDSDIGTSLGLGLGARLGSHFSIEGEFSYKGTLEEGSEDASLSYSSVALLYRW